MARPRLTRGKRRQGYSGGASHAELGRVLGIAPGGREITLADVQTPANVPRSGFARATLASGREISGTGEEWAARAGPSPGPRPESVAGYRRQRERQIATRESAAETLRRRYEPREGPAAMLARVHGMDPGEARALARYPGLREFILAERQRKGKLRQLELTAGYRAGLQGIKGKTSHELLGRRLGVVREGQAIREKIAGSQELHRQKEAIDRLGEHVKTREQKAERVRLGREAKAGSAAEKRRGERATEIQRQRERLQDRYFLLQDKANEVTQDEGLRRRLQAQADEAKAALDQHNARYPEEGAEAEAAGGETVIPEMIGGDTITPRMMGPEEAGQPSRPVGGYRTPAEFVGALRSGEIHVDTPGTGAMFRSLDAEGQDELRVWLKRQGFTQ